ncbi:MAG: hypothetical protein FJ265_05535 [Planctomycetes bacterium]|nr:hypothetical protein [Planctomycetota bacterium]
MPSDLLADARHLAARVGLNLFGVVDATRFDAGQPKDLRFQTRWPRCGTIVVLGNGGREFQQRFAVACATVATRPVRVPQEFARRCAHELAAHFAARRLPASVVMPNGRFPGFARLGEAAGFGTVSPVSGLLVHPEFGPWVTLRGALLFEGRPFGAVPDSSIVDRFQPCCHCRQPCLQSCPAAPADRLAVDGDRCLEHRQTGTCNGGCRCRARCPIGSHHQALDDEPRPAFVAGSGWSVLLRGVLRLWSR